MTVSTTGLSKFRGTGPTILILGFQPESMSGSREYVLVTISMAGNISLTILTSQLLCLVASDLFAISVYIFILISRQAHMMILTDNRLPPK